MMLADLFPCLTLFPKLCSCFELSAHDVVYDIVGMVKLSSEHSELLKRFDHKRLIIYDTTP